MLRFNGRIPVLSLAAALTVTHPILAQVTDASVTRHVETVRVAERVYAFIAPESFGGLVSGNSMLVIGDSAALVVDSGHFPLVTRQMIAEIRKLTPLPVRYLVNTHWHPDHWLGNAEFRRAYPDVKIISTAVTRAEIEQKGAGYLASYQDTSTLHQLRELAQGNPAAGQSADLTAYYTATLPDLEDALPGWHGVELAAPSVTFDDSLTIHLGGREARVIFPGRGNTAGDAMVVVPDAKVVATGDLVVNPTPYAYESFLGEWVGVLQGIEKRSPDAIVPGHGPVQHDLKYVRQLIELLSFVRTKTAEAVKLGYDLPATRTYVDLEPFRQQFAGSDPRRRRLFDIGFTRPAVKRQFDLLKEAMEKGTVVP